MSVMRKISKVAVALGVVASGFAFAAAGSLADIEAQVKTQFQAKKAPVDVARALIAAKTDLGLIATAFVHSGLTPAQAVAAIIEAGGDAGEVVTALLDAAGKGAAKEIVAAALKQAPGMSAQISDALIVAGLDPTELMPATAAGPSSGSTAAGVNGGSGGAGPVVNGSSFGGGGGGAASRS